MQMNRLSRKLWMFEMNYCKLLKNWAKSSVDISRCCFVNEYSTAERILYYPIPIEIFDLNVLPIENMLLLYSDEIHTNGFCQLWVHLRILIWEHFNNKTYSKLRGIAQQLFRYVQISKSTTTSFPIHQIGVFDRKQEKFINLILRLSIVKYDC